VNFAVVKAVIATHEGLLTVLLFCCGFGTTIIARSILY